jgi:nitrite reductase/ring-hydroxylating ferredoxin subunit
MASTRQWYHAAMDAPERWRCRTGDLGPGQTAKFRLACGTRTVEGFVVNHGGHYAAYVNVCAHAGTPLDLWPNEFYTEDGQWLICATHGAIYDPVSGRCVEGPCPGARLQPLRLTRDGDELVVSCP